MLVSTSIAQLSFFFSAISGFAQASPQNIPTSGNNGIAGGIFGPMGGVPRLGNIGDLLAGFSGNGQKPNSPNQAAPTSAGVMDFASIFKILGDVLQGKGDLRDMTPYMAYGKDFQDIRLTPEQEASPGTGPYPAGYVADASLPGKTIFAPKTPPKVRMPVIVWGEGGCLKTGTMYAPFLIEIASHGYLILANGPPSVGLPKKLSDLIPLVTSGQTKVTDMLESIDWIMAGNGAKYGDIDTTKIVAAGQSCGGAEALSASYRNDKIKLTVLVNSGAFTQGKALLQQIKYPIAIFNGGPLDIAYQNGELSYDALPKELPAYKANLDTGHIGTLFALNGGKFGKAVVSFLQWQLRADAKSKAICLDPSSPGSLVSDHWNVTHKNWI